MWMLAAAFYFYRQSHCNDGAEKAPQLGIKCLACLECGARNAAEYAIYGGPKP